jgi:hypothetical protein
MTLLPLGPFSFEVDEFTALHRCLLLTTSPGCWRVSGSVSVFIKMMAGARAEEVSAQLHER